MLKTYKRSSLKGRLTQKCFTEAVAKKEVDKVSANMGAIYALNKFEEVTFEAMHNSNTEALTEDLLKATLKEFKKKFVMDLEESIRKTQEVSDD